MRYRFLLLVLGILFFQSTASYGQVSINAVATAYTQNFDALATTGTANTWTDNTTILGWYANRTTYRADAGTSTTGALYSYGTGTNSDRALGMLTSGTAPTTTYMGGRYLNNTGVSVSSFDITYRGEQWRQNTTTQSLVFEYQVGATALTGGTWTAVSALDFAAINIGTAGALDGNAVGNYAVKTATITVTVANGQEIWFRWTKTGTTSHGLAIDDVSVTANSPCAASVAGAISLFSSTCGSSVLTYGGADAANCYWQTTSGGTSMANVATTNYTISTSGTYYIRNYNGTCWSPGFASATVTVNNNPAVTSSPTNVTVIEGNTASFTVGATNAGSYQWQVDTGSGSFVNISGATSATLTLTGVTLSMSGYKYLCIVNPSFPCTLPAVSASATLTVNPFLNSLSDIVAVSLSEAATIPTTVNNVTISTSTDGVQVWQFTVRDGGAASPDTDLYPTILTAFNIAQVGNTVSTWSDAIYSIGLFDGTTFIANGTVTGTQIQFSGLNVVVADDNTKTLTLRLSLKCSLGAGALDNDHFGFSISNANTTFSASGSGKSGFTAAASNNTKNVIAVDATKLTFTTQPVNTGQNNTMASVVVKATDACGNVDLGFTGTVSLTSTGTMNAVTPIAMTAGVATFTTIVHTVVGTGYTLTASAAGVSIATSTTFNITAVTIFSEGDFAVVGVNSNITCWTGSYVYKIGDDEISFITFKDIQNGDVFYITDNGYERTTAGLWGDTEGVYQFTRNGSTIPAGTIITFRFLQNNSGVTGGAPTDTMEFMSPDASWTFVKATGFTGTLNTNSGGDQIFFMQGGTWTNPAGTHDATYSGGTLLYAFNTGTAWNSFMNNTQQSGLPLALRCFNMMPGSATDYTEYTGPTTAASKYDWIVRLNDPTNWTNRGSCAGYLRTHVGMTYTINADTYVNGVWTGSKSTDWFDCANWQTLKVPTATTDVSVNATYATKDAVIDVVANATNAALYSNQAKCNNIAVSARKVQLEGNTANTLDVNGNLTISGAGAIDMDDSNSGTADGQINLYGNWTNSVGNTAFSEGNGTVQFTGTGTQVVSNVTPEGTETFYNVILNNNFDTTVSNDLIASNNLTINANKTLTVDSAGYVRVNNKLSNNGNVYIDNSGQLIQVNDTDTNDGTYTGTKFQVKRTAMAKNTDYIYWSSPLNTFDVSGIPNGYRYLWNTTYVNTNGTQGNWVPASGNMSTGKGYIARASNGASVATALPVTFSGSKPNNGASTFTVYRGNYTGIDYDADLANADNVLTTKYDDNWNLLGNPYPSAIDAENFLVLNQAVIDGSVWIWKHGLLPNSTTNPFYANFQYNYSSSDYIKYNGLGSTEPDTFAGKIASGQGFMVSMKDVGTFVSAGANTNLDVYSGTIAFNNSLRSDSSLNPYMPQNNTDFYKSAMQAEVVGNPTPVTEEKHRIWLDITNNTTQQSDNMLVGYSTHSTMGRDNLYDCFFVTRGEESLYSLIDDKSFIIQGRPLPFDENDQVPLGVSINQEGSHTIGIKKADGLFMGDTNIYLEDKQMHIIHDLKQAPYEFTSAKGTFDNRFVLRYTNSALATPDFNTLDNSVVVAANHGTLTIKSYLENLQQVTVYDVLGRQLLSVANLSNTEFSASDMASANQTLIVKIKLQNGTVVTRKVVL
ncbi:T9SS sorting signal type C domain-containing protein [Flavobacterium sp. XGLA_31]|uniref:T9SS sorting signal type C domain-containing protein n=1 Tax=Flavobacterium sp. XGLA_31 TaxID=3447666 RepID=UPI003F30CA71